MVLPCVSLPLYIIKVTSYSSVLDPRIGLEGLKAEANRETNIEDRLEYLTQIKSAVEDLKWHYTSDYVPESTTTQPLAHQMPATVSTTPRPFNFFAAYTPSEATPTDELDRFLAFHPLGFGSDIPNPIEWWKDHRNSYPHLARLARDILSIPGECRFHLIA